MGAPWGARRATLRKRPGTCLLSAMTPASRRHPSTEARRARTAGNTSRGSRLRVRAAPARGRKMQTRANMARGPQDGASGAPPAVNLCTSLDSSSEKSRKPADPAQSQTLCNAKSNSCSSLEFLVHTSLTRVEDFHRRFRPLLPRVQELFVPLFGPEHGTRIRAPKIECRRPPRSKHVCSVAGGKQNQHGKLQIDS